VSTVAHPRARAERAYRFACALDVAVRKPGNVSVASPGHGMTADQFIDSADVSATPLLEAGAPVGQRIEGAIRATRAAVGCNTNLGIVLLCAPLAAAAERATQTSAAADGRLASPEAVRAAICNALRPELAALTRDDARAAFRAIAHANPGGLGAAPQEDVRAEPTMDLRAAMQLAASRDRVARQYANDFADVFDTGVPAFLQFAATPAAGMLGAYLAFLASDLDSHIVRKHGATLAHSVTDDARRVLSAWLDSGRAPEPDALAAWDEQLKTDSINPGTSADLAVASVFVAALADPRLCDHPVPGLAWNVLNTRPTLTRLSG
jgi:triphosphoribosyl-dephospho-CoA synthase